MSTASLPLAPVVSTSIALNPHCVLRREADACAIVVAGIAVFHFHRQDRGAENLAIALALEGGWAQPAQLARALGRGVSTLHRLSATYRRAGAAALMPKRPGPQGPRLGAEREARIRQWYDEGLSRREMARRLSVSDWTVREALRRQGLAADVVAPASLPSVAPDVASDTNLAVPLSNVPVLREATTVPQQTCPPADNAATPLPVSLDADPAKRTFDRLLAATGQIDDAAPRFASAPAVPKAGVLLAIPLLVASGALDVAKQVYGSIGPAFYGLRTILVTLLLLALLRVKHPENVKEYSPPDLGAFIGLDRAPEVKTIRRKLARLTAEETQVDAFLQALLRRRVQSRDEALGFLYVDGHVRVYSGEHDLPKTHVARMRICLPATQDVWVNDADGSPLLVVTQEAHPSLVQALPAVLKRVRAEVGAGRRVTVVFDRGGFSPALFQQMDTDGFDVLTYRKGKFEPLPDDAFTCHPVPGTNDRETYELADGETTLSNGFVMRQVVRRTDNGHQTPILTTRRDLKTVEVAHRMFDRWRQENFFKYMRQEYALDALVEYGCEEADATREVPNPARKAVEKELAAARAELKRLEAKYGAAAADNREAKRPTMRGFKTANGKTGKALLAARRKVAALVEQRKALPERVAVGTVKDHPVRLPRLRKRLSDGLKMLAYQIETDLVRLLAPFYRRSADEGRTLLAAAFQSAADLEVTDGELRVTLAAQSSPHRTLAMAELCRLLDDTATVFPGSDLRLRFAIRNGDSLT